ncbi:hypothetical protein GCM10018775_87730 [Streptomyces umbrinus]|nr:hypothetical protein GCM10018775_87730 [Streptomyces umbrinus]
MADARDVDETALEFGNDGLGHLRPARKHVEMINVGGGVEGRQEAVKLGAWLTTPAGGPRS